ncbi:DEAD/DEAH box helicase [Virgibacillus sp. AGTR]|uniref:DEAD/DEAH box helicase n=1 Tax=Virgibacillus sp. AGTR TaxID=2812055 RepID=UPI001D16E0EF|nr:DEAD/DEAH box helicase [Virgibacillus sp. AGTR]MCC2252237.1 DEAD/DEAH box helicase [Virgibacillus sp. AGTR]
MDNNLIQQLSDIKSECQRLEKENQRLKEILKKHNIPFGCDQESRNDKNEEIVRRIQLFKNLFKGRNDVYAHRWEIKNGKSGYSPVYKEIDSSVVFERQGANDDNDYNKTAYKPLTDKSIYNHLIGKEIVGIYPLLHDNTCWFLALDFDKGKWKEESRALASTCHQYDIPVAIERSRSGEGCHIWIFFNERIPASKSRALGNFLLTETLKIKLWSKLYSFDRMFPTQDSRKMKGLGNLIALPLQKKARAEKNSVFIDKDMNVIPNQWEFLRNIKKLSITKLEAILINNAVVHKTEQHMNIEPNPKHIHAVLKNGIYIRKQALPAKLLDEIIRLAVFYNPNYYKARAKRLSTHDIPRSIDCSWQDTEHVIIPRGCINSLKDLLQNKSIQLTITNQCYQGKAISCEFQGDLSFQQAEAVDQLIHVDNGVIAATTGFGKTVLAASLIAQRGINTLIIVHRKQLINQWKEKLLAFLKISEKSIGQIGGGKNKPSHCVDIATIQSLNRNDGVKNSLTEYGQVIVDECHHISAFSFEKVLQHVMANYVYGLTATPSRKDGLHPIMNMQCGPIVYKVSAKKQAKVRPFQHILIPRHTSFKSALEDDEKKMVELGTELVNHQKRNGLIFNDVLKELDNHSTPIILTERIEHIRTLEQMFKGFVKNIIILNGNLSAKQKQQQLNALNEISDQETLIIATGKYIGEGFDNDRLDCLFLVYPISWEGTLQQYVGRLHRLHQNKTEVKVYDYVDHQEPFLQSMYKKRLKGYHSIGYRTKEKSANDPEQMELF